VAFDIEDMRDALPDRNAVEGFPDGNRLDECGAAAVLRFHGACHLQSVFGHGSIQSENVSGHVLAAMAARSVWRCLMVVRSQVSNFAMS